MNYVFLDFETTGLNSLEDRLTQVSAIKVNVDDKDKINFLTSYINPERPIPQKLVDIIGITDEMVKDAPKESLISNKLFEFIGMNSIIVAQNAPFDLGFLHHLYERNNIEYKPYDFYCTRTMSATMFSGISHSLIDIVNLFDIKLEKAHDAYADCEATKKLFYRLKHISDILDLNFKNKLIIHPDRPMSFKPENMILIPSKKQ